MEKLKATNKVLALITAVFMFIVSASCGNTNDGSSEEFEETTDYTGIWYSGEQDARAYQLLDNGMYISFSIPLGEEPVQEDSGIYRKIKGEDSLSFGYSFNGVYQQKYQLSIRSDKILYYKDIEFHKISDEQDNEILYTLRVMTVPMERYVGKWENDSNFTRLTITDHEEYIITYYDKTSVGIVTKSNDYLLVGLDDLKIVVTENGGLNLEGTNGTFYPEGDERVMNGAHKAFIGRWYNETTDDTITFNETGDYIIVDGKLGSENSIIVGITYGRIDFNDGVLTYTFNDKEYAAEINGSIMTMSGIEGVFEKE